MTLGALVEVSSGDSKHAVVSLNTVDTIVDRLCSWQRVFAICASSWQLCASQTEEAGWAQVLFHVGGRGTRQTEVSLVASLAAAELTVLAVVSSWTGTALVQFLKTSLVDLGVSAIWADNWIRCSSRAVMLSWAVLWLGSAINIVTVGARWASLALAHSLDRSVRAIGAFLLSSVKTVAALVARLASEVVVRLSNTCSSETDVATGTESFGSCQSDLAAVLVLIALLAEFLTELILVLSNFARHWVARSSWALVAVRTLSRSARIVVIKAEVHQDSSALWIRNALAASANKSTVTEASEGN